MAVDDGVPGDRSSLGRFVEHPPGGIEEAEGGVSAEEGGGDVGVG